MYEQIKATLTQIKTHRHLHHVTIFNKEKNSSNMHAHNIIEGKLLVLLKALKYFKSQIDQFGSHYGLSVLSFIQCQHLRSDSILVNTIENNQPNVFLLVEGVLRLYQNNQKRLSPNQVEEEDFTFVKYLSNGIEINFSEYRECQFKLVCHEDCKLLKLPNKGQIDPTELSKKSSDLMRQAQKNNQIIFLKEKISQMVVKLRRIKKNVSFDPSFGLGAYDFNELLLHSSIRRYQAQEVLCPQDSIIDQVGLILQGRVALESKKLSMRKFVSSNDAILSFYKKQFKPHDQQKSEGNRTVLEEGQWVGGEEYLKKIQTQPFRCLQTFGQGLEEENRRSQFKKRMFIVTKKEILAVQRCEVMWVPLWVFAQKFNYQTNFQTLDKWMALIDIKEQNRKKQLQLLNITHHGQFSKNQPFQLPKVNKTLNYMGHNFSTIEQKTQHRKRLILQNQKKFKKSTNRKLQISQTSLLGVTLKDHCNSINTPQQIQMQQRHDFSQFSKETLSKKIFQGVVQNKRKGKGSSFKSVSEPKLQPSPLDDTHSFEDLIMYPQQYQAGRLAPDLKKQMILAEKCLKLEASQYRLPGKHRSICLDSSRLHCFQQKFNSSQKTLNSQQTLNDSKATSSLSSKVSANPQNIYRSLAEKICYKYPSLEQKIRAQKNHNRKEVRSVLKQKIKMAKLLEQMQREKNKKKHSLCDRRINKHRRPLELV